MYKISLNGLDGSGKTTQYKLLKDRFPYGYFSNDIGYYNIFPNLRGDDFFKWWFLDSKLEEFCDTIYRGIKYRDDEAIKKEQQLIINDKGVFTFDCRILANFLMRGYNNLDIYNQINMSKKKYGINSENLSLFLNIDDTTKLNERLRQRNDSKINSYDDYYHNYQIVLNDVTKKMIKKSNIQIINAVDDINNVFNKIIDSIINKNQKFIFISGVSESGKSTASEYLTHLLPNSVHVKMRDILNEMYLSSGSNLEKHLWMKEQEKNDSYRFWYDFILLTSSSHYDNEFIVLDTLYGIDAIKSIYRILKNNVNLIYIEASYHNRVYREYMKLKENRSITIDEVADMVEKKDRNKQKFGLLNLKKLSIYNNELVIDDNSSYTPFTYIVNNDGNVGDFKNQLSEISDDIKSKEVKVKCIKRT